MAKIMVYVDLVVMITVIHSQEITKIQDFMEEESFYEIIQPDKLLK